MVPVPKLLLETMAMKDPEPDDRHHTVRQILHHRHSDLASELMDIQKHTKDVEKAHVWAENPLCLLHQGHSPRTFRCIRNRRLERPFVAISWTWKPSKYESNESGNYWVEHSHTGKVNKIEARNCILDRVTTYLLSIGEEVFWMDIVCINQHDKKEQEEAMNSMDLIYKCAKKSVALLSTPSQSQHQLEILVRLIAGKLVIATGNHFRLQQDVGWTTMKRAVRLLDRITRDPWWTRGWTFQEEYLAGMNMDILLPLSPGVGSVPGSGDTPGEYCVPATRFREQVTIFLQACSDSENPIRQQAGKSWQHYRTICSRSLKVVAKYSLVLTGPMSARIHTDVRQRNVTNPWDTLAITANACGYKIRLEKEALLRKNQSLSLCLLAQFLLNGEITISNWQIAGFLDLPICRLLEKVSPTSWHLPDLDRPLSFLKHCRLARVEIQTLGCCTEGFLWELNEDDRIFTSNLRPPERTEDSRQYLKDRPWEAMELRALCRELDRSHRDVANRLNEYLEGRQSGRSWAGCEYMDIMAWDLVQAVQQRYVLRIGYLKNKVAGSIFIPRRKDIRLSMFVFTTWCCGRSHEYGLDNYVSIQVAVQQDGSLSMVQWMKGLLFLPRMKTQKVMVKSF